MTSTWSVITTSYTLDFTCCEGTPLFSWDDFRSKPKVKPRYPRYAKKRYADANNVKRPYTMQFTGHRFRVGGDKE